MYYQKQETLEKKILESVPKDIQYFLGKNDIPDSKVELIKEIKQRIAELNENYFQHFYHYFDCVEKELETEQELD